MEHASFAIYCSSYGWVCAELRLMSDSLAPNEVQSLTEIAREARRDVVRFGAEFFISPFQERSIVSGDG